MDAAFVIETAGGRQISIEEKGNAVRKLPFTRKADCCCTFTSNKAISSSGGCFSGEVLIKPFTQEMRLEGK